MECPICNNTGFKRLLFFNETSRYDNKTYPLYQCKNCLLIRPKPLPYTDSSKSNIYNKNDLMKCYNPDEEVIDEFSEEYKDYFKNFKIYIDLIKKYKIFGNHLDIGCGSGHLIKLSKNQDLNVSGIEINQGAVNQLKKKGFNVSNKKLSQLKSNSYDLITMNHVFEHIENLQEFTREINVILKKQGYLILAVPYIYGIMPKLLRTKWYGQGYGQHLNFFSIKSLKLLLENNGFRVINVQKLSLDYSFTWLPRPIKIITSMLTKIIIYSKLGDNLVILAKKIS